MPAETEAVGAVEQLALISFRFPGEHRLRVDIVADGAVTRSLLLGENFHYAADHACLAALREFGEVEVCAG